MKTANLRGALCFLAAAAILAGLNSGCRRKYKLAAPAHALTAQQLFKDFKDEKAATDKYLGKVLEISGLVDHVGLDSADQPFVGFKGEEGVGDVQCFFPRSQADEIAKIPKGRNVTLRGVCLTKVIHVALDNCEFVSK